MTVGPTDRTQQNAMCSSRLDDESNVGSGVTIDGSLSALRQNSFHDLGWLNSGEPLVEALEFVGEQFVMDPELVQEGGVQVSDVNGVFHDVVGEFVGFAVNGSALDAASGHPQRETTRMVIASIIGVG